MLLQSWARNTQKVGQPEPSGLFVKHLIRGFSQGNSPPGTRAKRDSRQNDERGPAISIIQRHDSPDRAQEVLGQCLFSNNGP